MFDRQWSRSLQVTRMGTESHGIYNLFAKLLKNEAVQAVGLKASDSSVQLKNIVEAGLWWGINHLESMDRSLNSYNRDYVRNTMLKHEETFRHQVRELHRVYGVQKMLMAELKNKEVKFQHHGDATPAVVADVMARHWGSASTSETSYSSHVSNANANQSAGQMNRDPSSLYQFMAVAGSSSRHRGFDLEQPVEEDHIRTVSSGFISGNHMKGKTKVDSTDSWPEDETDTELTISLGCGTDKRRPQR